MKNLVMAVVAVTFIAVPLSYSFAEDTGPGCGVGQMIFKDNKKVVFQTLAATTNGTFANQLFGITSGTLGCTNDGIVKNDQEVAVFASVNLENLSQEMAQGRGEYLSSLASLMGIPAEQHAAFGSLTQEKYAALFASDTTTSGELLVALKQEMSSHPTFSQAVVR
jgi:hypothetical protein